MLFNLRTARALLTGGGGSSGSSSRSSSSAFRNIIGGLSQQRNSGGMFVPESKHSRMMMSTASMDHDSFSFDTKGHIGNAVEHAMTCLYKADAVCFDVDSTVIAEEGIDTLADYLGKGEAVAALTREAMEGGMAFQDALQARLELLQPSKPSILQCLKDQPLVLTEGVQTLMQALQQKQVDIWLVSGGFRIMIEPVAERLDIPIENIYANTLFFHDDGSYKSFDANEPTSADMGKPKALTQIHESKQYNTMVMVGDGATDAQAKPPAKAFIGFGGVIERSAVKAKADWFVTDFAHMTQIVQQRT